MLIADLRIKPAIRDSWPRLHRQHLGSAATSPSWEPQQRWLVAHYTLATDYLSRGDYSNTHIENDANPFVSNIYEKQRTGWELLSTSSVPMARFGYSLSIHTHPHRFARNPFSFHIHPTKHPGNLSTCNVFTQCRRADMSLSLRRKSESKGSTRTPRSIIAVTTKAAASRLDFLFS
jgi:hypothetical protein